MDGKPRQNHFVHVTAVEEMEEAEDGKCSNDGSEIGDDTVPLGLTGKAVCMQVFMLFSF